MFLVWQLLRSVCGASSEFVSSSIPSWQILTAHAQPFTGTSDLAFCLKVPLDSLLIWVSSGGSGETAWMHRLAWTLAARISDKYQIRLTRPSVSLVHVILSFCICLLTNDYDLKYTYQEWYQVFIHTGVGNNEDADQTPPRGAVWSGSGSTLFVILSA